MRKVFQWGIAGMMVAFMACQFPEVFQVSGQMTGMQDGRVFVLVADGEQWDTLAMAEMENGHFLLTGEMNGVTVADLVFENQASEKIMLERARYVVSGAKDSIVVEGGEAQALFNRFNALNQQAVLEENVITERYYAAEKENDEAGMEQAWRDFDTFLDSYHAQENALIQANPDAYVSAYVVYNALCLMDFERFMCVSLKEHVTNERLAEKYALLGDVAKQMDYGKSVGDYLAKQDRVAEGAVAPDFTMNTIDGKELTLHAITAKVKLIDFWASWCGPCRQENPRVVNLYNKYHDKGLEIIGISLDDNREKWEQAVQQDSLTWLHASDLKGWQSPVALLYQVKSIPATFLLDENNRILAKNLRGPALEEKIKELLNVK